MSHRTHRTKTTSRGSVGRRRQASGQPKVRDLKNFMRKFNIPGEVSGRGSRWEVELPDDDAGEMFEKSFGRVFPGVGYGGYRTGYGAWVFSADYVSKGDFNDPSSRHHYAGRTAARPAAAVRDAKDLIRRYLKQGRPFTFQDVCEDPSEPADQDLYEASSQMVKDGEIHGPDPHRARGNHGDWRYTRQASEKDRRMSDKTLRSKVIRLAHARPELRADLLGALREAGELPPGFQENIDKMKAKSKKNKEEGKEEGKDKKDDKLPDFIKKKDKKK